jgi:hydroxyacylglutathione hydrolase
MTAKQSPIYIKQFEIGPMDNFVYFIGDALTREVFVIDPGWDAGKILEEAKQEKVTIKDVLLTHSHFDHVNAMENLLAETGGAAYVHEKEAPFLKGTKVRLKLVKDGDKIKIGDIEIACLHTPGHTPGGQCFLVDGNLFSGDTLFIGACGRCDLPGSSAEAMYASLLKLSKLDEATVVYPGHNYAEGPASTIGREKKSNPYMQFGSEGEFRRFRLKEQ